MNAGSTARSALAAAVTVVSGARAVVQTADGSAAGADALPDQAIFYANHSSHLDFVTLWSVLPPRLRDRVRPVAARDYWSSGLRRTLAVGVFHAHLVDRGTQPAEGGRRTDQITGMTDVLDRGDSLIIFPEGTRGSESLPARFQGGLYRLALHDPAIPVVPVVLGNLGRILPKGETVPVPHLATVTFRAPIRVGDGETREDFLARARAALIPDTADERPDENTDGTPS